MKKCKVQENWLDYNELINKEGIINQIKLCDGIILQGGNANEAFKSFIAKFYDIIKTDEIRVSIFFLHVIILVPFK